MDFLPQLGLRRPLIVAPMAGGPTTPRLVAVCSNAGAFGSLGAAYLPSQEITAQIAQVRGMTDKPFAVNLFLPNGEVQVQPARMRAALESTQIFRDRWNIPAPTLRPPYEQSFDAQFEAVLEAKPAALSFVFGALERPRVQAAQKRGLLVLGAATTLAEAEAQEASGVDAVTLQGVEAGGHRAIFDKNRDDSNLSMMRLLKDCVGRIKVPLIAAGGLMNREDVARTLAAGAAAVQLGTAFLACAEAGTSKPYRRALQQPVRTTALTRVFSGRLARGMVNAFMEVVPADAVLPFPLQNVFTRHLRHASVEHDSADCLSLWAGTGQGALWTGSARDLIEQLFTLP